MAYVIVRLSAWPQIRGMPHVDGSVDGASSYVHGSDPSAFSGGHFSPTTRIMAAASMRSSADLDAVRAASSLGGSIASYSGFGATAAPARMPSHAPAEGPQAAAAAAMMGHALSLIHI